MEVSTIRHFTVMLTSFCSTIHSDLVFIQDATGSMGSYIASGESMSKLACMKYLLMLATTATRNIETICETIISHEKMENEDDLRVGVSGSNRMLLISHESDSHVRSVSDCRLS